MNYCVSARQPNEVIKKAEEVFLEWRDREYLSQLIVEVPKIKINFHIPYGETIPLKKIQNFIHEGANIVLVLDDLREGMNCQAYKIPYYWSKKITTFWEVRNAVRNNVSELYIGAPLFFDLATVAKFRKPIRIMANLAVDDINFLQETGERGTYVRPEDIPYYDEYVKTIVFYSEGLKQEETLLKIYKETKVWPGDLSKLIANLKTSVDNRGLPDEFAKARIQCRQNCMRTGTCRFCETAFIFSRSLDKANEEWVASENEQN